MKITFNRTKYLLIGLCTCSLLIQTGCWSKDEIEELSIYVGVALDQAKETKLEAKLGKLAVNANDRKLLSVTLQIVNKQSEEKGGNSAGDPATKAYLNVSETGDSIIDMIRQLSTRMERPAIGHHLKVIVINEQLARHKSMYQLLDFFLRDNDIRPNCVVMMSSGLAKHTLEAKGNSIVPAFRLMGMLENRYRTLKIMPRMTLYKLEKHMHAESSYMLQNVVAAEGEVKLSGAAVIKGKTQKFRGLLNEEELLGVILLSGEAEGGIIKCVNEKTNEMIAYELKAMNSEIYTSVDGDNVSFDVKMKSEGRIIEDWSENSGPIDDAYRAGVEQSVEREIMRLAKQGLDKIQKEYKADVVGFGTRLSIEQPKLWQKVKKNWDQAFSRIPITYSVELTITETGTEKSQ
ncbi:Ger(x)C family spore germination protein [Paenibacillus alkaliterrae]|uniref:Ger(x)C family spore germination protein n=1 Tax=Paenibacillus alkaliterrae TaxID=320909 RepID=UPI001F3310EF|nr:Ger(x)C family spore germination protein [Paenibacillus alkaliterrae]MCF2938220.1 Ger(x)C family spore germination protein [Paenibacillus alkaliterrae]